MSLPNFTWEAGYVGRVATAIRKPDLKGPYRTKCKTRSRNAELCHG